MKIETEQQRKELLQDVIDRLLYLPNGEQEKFVRLLELSLNKFQIAYNIKKGDCRIYQKNNLGKQ
jgi:chromatin remodeling complex protein RSC6